MTFDVIKFESDFKILTNFKRRFSFGEELIKRCNNNQELLCILHKMSEISIKILFLFPRHSSANWTLEYSGIPLYGPLDNTLHKLHKRDTLKPHVNVYKVK